MSLVERGALFGKWPMARKTLRDFDLLVQPCRYKTKSPKTHKGRSMVVGFKKKRGDARGFGMNFEANISKKHKEVEAHTYAETSSQNINVSSCVWNHT